MSLSKNFHSKTSKVRVNWLGNFDLTEFAALPEFLKKEVEVFCNEKPSSDFDIYILESIPKSELALTDKAHVFFVGPQLTSTQLIQLNRRFHVIGLSASSTKEVESKARILKQAADYFGESKKKTYSIAAEFRKSSEKRKELENLNVVLEQKVFERTKHIEISAQEQSAKLDNERSLIRLIKDLSFVLSVEDLLTLFRKEIRKFSYVGEPFLIYTIDGEQHSWLQFKNATVKAVTKQADESAFSYPKTVKFEGPQALKTLVNLVGRPMAKSLMIPLDLAMSARSFPRAQAMLCVEMINASEESLEFRRFIEDRTEILSMTLDRILLEYQLGVYSYRWEKTFDAFRDGVAIISSNFELLRGNRKFFLSEIKMRGQKCHQLFAGLNSPCPGCPLLESKDEVRVSKLHIEEKIFELHSYTIHNQVEKVFVHQYVNITEKEKMNTQLLQNEKMSSLGLLAGHLAHELNNPLSGILTLTQVVAKQSQLQPELNRGTLVADVLEIQNATLRSLGIIRNLIEFSQEGAVEPLETSIDALVEKTIPFVKTALRNHRFFKDLKTKNEMVLVEPHLVQQVIFNLIKNASQAMDNPGTIKVYSHNPGGNVVELVVEDTGHGIPESLQSHVFEAFFTTKKKGEGTGLGLNLSRSIVERFNGQLSFKSKEGVGTQFFVRFPVVRRLS